MDGAFRQVGCGSGPAAGREGSLTKAIFPYSQQSHLFSNCHPIASLITLKSALAAYHFNEAGWISDKGSIEQKNATSILGREKKSGSALCPANIFLPSSYLFSPLIEHSILTL